MDIVKLKAQMRAYAGKHGLKVPRVMWKSTAWGLGARTLAWRVSGHYGKATTSAEKLWRHFNAPPLHILHPTYAWNGYPVERTGPPKGIVWHHEAGSGMGPEQIHAYHRDTLGWRGIAYHLYVRLDGKVYAGRPLDTIGGHAKGAGDWLGVCLEGNYDVTREVPKAQLEAAKAVHAYLRRKFGPLKDVRHRDMPGNATACPGRYFPMERITD